ncbi:DUF2306 domain-containing protein [Rhizobium sp. YIM 134829]|uniref:DUF2306 domain-containing protein n=1 Tax=Rhizobium sp. YIM 134829 TaxID=3390453 RepID=UPI003977FF2D
MTLEPLLSAPPVVLAHVLTVIPAALLGALLMAGRKGTRWHKRGGRVWIGLMATTALLSFFIHDRPGVLFGFSPIHLLSVLTLSACWQAVSAARRGDIRRHRTQVRILYAAAILGAGLFTLAPGRRMHAVLFSGPPQPAALITLLVAAVVFALLLFRLAERRARVR